MYNRNHLEFIGNIASNPEIRSLDGGKRVCNLRLAVNETWKDDAGGRQERVEFLPLTIWNPNTIDLVEKYIRKGQYVLVTGKVTTSKKERDGETTYQTNLVAQRFQFLQPKGDAPDDIGTND
jgi:single-strand DNA-binding protein